MEPEVKNQEITKDPRQEYLKAVVTDPKKMLGVWELTIKITNTQGVKAFGGRMLTKYVHPLTGKMTALFDMDNTEQLGLMIDKPTMVYHPDTIPMHRRIVDWLIAHPEVDIEGVDLREGVKEKKQSNNSIKLKNVDRQEITEIDNEDRIDYIIGKISDENPKTGLSIERLRYLLAYFNLPYFEFRFITNKLTEKKFLRKKLKNFARGEVNGELNADKIKVALDEVDNLKIHYEFKEMLRNGLITESYGTFKFNNVPLGSTEESSVTFLRTNTTIYNEICNDLYPMLKKQGF